MQDYVESTPAWVPFEERGAAMREHAETVRAAFPDFHNTVEQTIAEGDRLAACLTWRGTHSGGAQKNGAGAISSAVYAAATA